jgi:hypothetical protein
MKKIRKISIISAAVALVIAIVYAAIFLTSRTVVTAYSTDEYEKIFNSREYKDHEVRTFGKGSYYSYLFSLPRHAPENVEELQFVYEKNMYGKTSAFYLLSYTLSETEYAAYKGSLSNYALHYYTLKNSLIYTEDAFDYPAYVFEYMSEDGEDIRGGVAEYVHLDDSENRVICVYYSGVDYEKLKLNMGINVSPKSSSVASVTGGRKNIYAEHSGFSVYCFVGADGSMRIPSIKEFTFAS